jgi:hypothetical protein
MREHPNHYRRRMQTPQHLTHNKHKFREILIKLCKFLPNYYLCLGTF